jgi:hypothetical protein
MARLLCPIGIHQWSKQRNPDGGETYLECERCHKQKDSVALMDYDGGGFG